MNMSMKRSWLDLRFYEYEYETVLIIFEILSFETIQIIFYSGLDKILDYQICCMIRLTIEILWFVRIQIICAIWISFKNLHKALKIC